MIHPTSLVAADSLDGFIAPVETRQPVPCGLTMYDRVLSSPCLQRFATARSFLVALSVLTLLQGAAQGYLATTAQVIAQRFDLPSSFVDWLLVGSELVQGTVALAIAYWGGRGHRPSWIAGCVLFHATTCLILAMPLITHGADSHAGNITKDVSLCRVNPPAVKPATDPCWFTMVMLVLAQVGAAVSATSLMAHGFTYLDDNTEKADAPTLFGIVMCVRQFGPKLGQVLAYYCSSLSGASAGRLVRDSELNGAWWLGWPLLAVLMMLAAILVAMFPPQVTALTVNAYADSILDMATGRVHISEQRQVIEEQPSHKFCPTVKRLFTNMMVVCSALSTVFMSTAFSNFHSLENRYLESVYFIPDPEHSSDGVFNDRWVSRVTTGFLKPPLVGMALLLAGLIISRTKPRPTILAIWNVVLALTAAAIFFSYISLGCPLLSLDGNHATSLQLDKKCNAACNCPLSTPFQPVCSQDGTQTYYSPCHAGCQTVEFMDDVEVFKSCSCLRFASKARRGPCSQDSCTGNWVTFQALGTLVATLLGTGMVGHLLLCLRCVLPQDKPAMLGLQLMLVGKAVLPGKTAYRAVADATCKYWGDNTYTCRLFHSPDLVLYINVLSGCLLLVSALFGVFVCLLVRRLDLYGEVDVTDGVEMNELQRQKLSKRMATPAVRRRQRDVPKVDSDHDGEEENASSETNSLMGNGISVHRPAQEDASSPVQPPRGTFV